MADRPDERGKTIKMLFDKDIPKSKFVVGDYMRGGYPVRLNDYTWHIAVFVDEGDAQQYADYRTAMMYKYNTTDVSLYEIL